MALACGLLLEGAVARAADAGAAPEGLSEVSAKLSNPVSDLWAINMQVGMAWSDGDVNRGGWQSGGFFQLQPALPIRAGTTWYNSIDRASRSSMEPGRSLLRNP
jgi:hypothetical protein